jgi:hypothetical protein
VNVKDVPIKSIVRSPTAMEWLTDEGHVFAIVDAIIGHAEGMKGWRVGKTYQGKTLVAGHCLVLGLNYTREGYEVLILSEGEMVLDPPADPGTT